MVKKASSQLFKQVLNGCAKNQGRAGLQTSRCVATPAPKSAPNAVLAAAAVEIIALLTVAGTGAVRPVCAVTFICRCDLEATAGRTIRGWPGDARADRTTRRSFATQGETKNTRSGHLSIASSKSFRSIYIRKYFKLLRQTSSTSRAANVNERRRPCPQHTARRSSSGGREHSLFVTHSHKYRRSSTRLRFNLYLQVRHGGHDWATRGRPGDVRADRTVREPFERRKERPKTRGPAMRRESRPSNNDRREARLAGRCDNRPAGDATPGQGSPSDARPTGRRARCDARLSARGEPGRCCAITLVERSCVSVALALVVQRTARLCWFL